MFLLTTLVGCFLSTPSDPELDCEEPVTWYVDADKDNYGGEEVTGCERPSALEIADVGGDCDDDDRKVNPDREETCDGVDEDCDGEVDQDVGKKWYKDADGDDFGTHSDWIKSCSSPGGKRVREDGDCDDDDDTVYPGAPEQCNGVDNDCDDEIDNNATDAPTWYNDNDDDGYGNPASTAKACDAPYGYVSNSSDCNDSTELISPAATEECNGLDSDCNGVVDDAANATIFYPDLDGDGFGDTGSVVYSCDEPTDMVDNDEDCDDSDAGLYPGAPELCDGRANDCGATSWVTSDEDGTVAFFPSSGVPLDATSWVSGTVSSPAAYTFAQSGTLNFCSGTFYVSVQTTWPDVVLQGQNGAANTILSSGSAGAVAHSDDASLEIYDLTLDGGTGYVDGAYTYGGAVHVQGSTLVMDGVVVSNNGADNGGGLYATTSDVTITNSTFEYNDAVSTGGAIFSTGYTELNLTDVAILDNTASGSGAIYSGATMYATNLAVERNGAASVGAITIGNGTGQGWASIDGGVFNDNWDTWEAGTVYVMGWAYLETSDTVWDGNNWPALKVRGSASMNGDVVQNSLGDALYVDTEGVLDLVSVLVADNAGHGVYLHDYAMLTCTGTVNQPEGFLRNDGYGIYRPSLNNSEASLTSCDFGDGTDVNELGPFFDGEAVLSNLANDVTGVY
jgi:predicted outer membrane repeat protein